MKFTHPAILASLAVLVTAYPINQGTDVKKDSTMINDDTSSIKRSPLEQAAQGDPQPYDASHAAQPPKPEEKHAPTAPVTPPPASEYGKTPEKPATPPAEKPVAPHADKPAAPPAEHPPVTDYHATPQTPPQPEKQPPPEKPQQPKYSPPVESPHEQPKAPESKQPEAPHAQPPAYVPPPSTYQSSSGAVPQHQDAQSSTPSGDHAAPVSGSSQQQQAAPASFDHGAPASEKMQQQPKEIGKEQEEGKHGGEDESEDEDDDEDEEGEGKDQQEARPIAGASSNQPSQMHHGAPQHAPSKASGQAPSSNGYSQKDPPVAPTKPDYAAGAASDPHGGH